MAMEILRGRDEEEFDKGIFFKVGHLGHTESGKPKLKKL